VDGAARRGPGPRWLWALVVLALAVRLWAVAATPDYLPRTDAVDFDRHAVTLVETGDYPSSGIAPGGGPSAFRPPLFPLALAGVYALAGTGDAEARWEAGRVFQALLGAVAVGLIGLIALRVWGRTVGLVAAALGAVYPPLVVAGTSLMSEPLFVALVLAAVLAALVARDSPRPLPWAALAGALAAGFSLTRSNGAILVLALAALAWAGRPRLDRRALAAPAVLLGAFALGIAPWTARNVVVLDAFVPISTQTGYALAGTYNEVARNTPGHPASWRLPQESPVMRRVLADRTLREPALSRELRAASLDYVRDHPAYPLAVAFWNGARLLGLQGTEVEREAAYYVGYDEDLAEAAVHAFWAAALLALAGALTAAARRPPAAFWAVPALIVAVPLLVSGLGRYRTPADPFVLMLAALGLVALARRLRRNASPTAVL
jgi:hypothetical protein